MSCSAQCQYWSRQYLGTRNQYLITIVHRHILASHEYSALMCRMMALWFLNQSPGCSADFEGLLRPSLIMSYSNCRFFQKCYYHMVHLFYFAYIELN